MQVVSTQVPDGDFAVGAVEPYFSEVRAVINPTPWTWLTQVHGTEVLEVSAPGQHAGAVADGAVTFTPGCPIAVTTADCAPVVLATTSGVAVVHAGWRGALAGIIANAAQLLTASGEAPVSSWLGPCISVSQYEFGADDLERLMEAFGPSVRGATSAGKPALNMHQVVSNACVQAGFPPVDQPACTSGPQYFSHRVRGDIGRQCTVAWIG